MANVPLSVSEFVRSATAVSATADVGADCGAFCDARGTAYASFRLDMDGGSAALIVPAAQSAALSVRVGSRYALSGMALCSALACDPLGAPARVCLVALKDARAQPASGCALEPYAALAAREGSFAVRGTVSGVTAAGARRGGAPSFAALLSDDDGAQVTCVARGDDCARLRPAFRVGEDTVVFYGHVALDPGARALCLHLDERTVVVTV